ncbi:3-keto-5-aminohexanoate cleavage protein [Vibrio alfacsensis]|uniref:3-keto-5-aminohexanoate cleavage protein n=1 Tax=Vibrio alfacsensis TaxID=1074311 RepID=UPI001BEE9C68|nr:3-keto-5-aminohexanoate cleavage protein [Vibrio alfacsensis]BBM65514.1 3-keto-5-aminohexanoate cleavage protein [Vibrio alfacsensis]
MVMDSPLERSKVAIIVAPNGARKTKHDHLNLPMSIDEMVAEAKACQRAGAAMIHLHTRDTAGNHSLEIKDNLEMYHAVKDALGDAMLVQLTTEAVGMYSPQQQIALIDAVKPEAASFALRELFPDEQSQNQSSAFFHRIAEQGILSQIILYDQNDIDRYFFLREKGLLPDHYQHALVVLGRYQKEQQSSPWDLRALNLARFFNSDFVTPEVRCAVCAFGAREQDCLTSAMLLGLDIRVGFENNHFSANGVAAHSNAEQVEKLKVLSQQLHIPLHDAASLREAIKDTETERGKKKEKEQEK